MGLKNISTVIFDLNGTLYERGIAVKGANATLKILREKGFNLSFITNTDARSIKDVYKSVINKELEIKEDELFTPISAIKVFIEEHRNKSYYPLVHNDVLSDFEGLKIDNENPDYVIIGDFCDKVSYEEINKVFRMIKNGAEIIATSKTLWYIDFDGYSINTGAFVKMFEAACDKQAILMGKPSKNYFEMALKRTKSNSKNTIIIGDDIHTDILGAVDINAVGILVKTGVFSENQLNKVSYKPQYIVENVNCLLNLLGV